MKPYDMYRLHFFKSPKREFLAFRTSQVKGQEGWVLKIGSYGLRCFYWKFSIEPRSFGEWEINFKVSENANL